MSDNQLLSAAKEVLDLLDEARVPACLIGALAVHRWGEPRATRDVDVSVLAPYGDEGRVLDLLLGRFASRRTDARPFAIEHRVLLLKSATGPDLDLALAAFPFELEALERASAWEAAPGVRLRTCPAEHLIIYKLVAARPHDLVDIEGIVRRQRGRLDVDRIRYWGEMLAELKEDQDLLRPFEDLLRKTR
jgi:hypothetical protein